MNSSTPTRKTNRRDLFPFAEQEPFLDRGKTYYGYISGVGAGKTHAGMMRVALNVLQWNPGEMGAIVAPTTTMIKDVIIPLMRDAGLLDRWEYRSMHADEPGLHVPNGSRVLLLSADNRRTIERLAGLNLAWWWLDEASRTEPRALEILTQRLRVGQYRNGFITTTPRGRDHIYDFFVGDIDGEWTAHGEGELYEAPDRIAITHVPTWANPFTAADYKDQMRKKEGQTYEREILGRFVDYEGLVYPWFNADRHTIPPDAVEDRQMRRTIYGVDWGYNNPSVVLALQSTNSGDIYVRDEFYESRVTTDDLVGVLRGLYDEYGRGTVYCDPAEPESIETFTRAGIDAVGGINDVLPGIQHVTAMRDQLIIERTCRNLIDEFGMYRYPDGGGEKPVDANNHACDALRYALFTDAERGHSVGVTGMDFI